MKILRSKKDKEQFIFWIETLRAGVLPQGRLNLQSMVTGGYCCLGVAQACSVKDILTDGTGRIVGAMPSKLINSPTWLINISDKNFRYRDKDIKLAYLNDSSKLPHSEIADIIWEQMKHEL